MCSTVLGGNRIRADVISPLHWGGGSGDEHSLLTVASVEPSGDHIGVQNQPIGVVEQLSDRGTVDRDHVEMVVVLRGGWLSFDSRA